MARISKARNPGERKWKGRRRSQYLCRALWLWTTWRGRMVVMMVMIHSIPTCVVGRLSRPEGLSSESNVGGDVTLPLLRCGDAYSDNSDIYHAHGKEKNKAEWILRARMHTPAAVVGDAQEKREMNCLSLTPGDRPLVTGSKLASRPNSWRTGGINFVSMTIEVELTSSISVPISTAVSHSTTLMVTQGNPTELLYSGAATPTAGSSGVLLLVRGTVISTASLSASSASSGSSGSSHDRSRLEAMLKSASSGQSWTPSSSRSTSSAAGTQAAFRLAVPVGTGSRRSAKLGQILPGALVGGIVFLAMIVAVGIVGYRRRRRRKEAEAESEAARRGMVRQSLPSQWWW